jgi:hypothetical protein
VKKLPDLKKYRVRLVTGTTSHEGREPWDGIADGALAAAFETWVKQVAERVAQHVEAEDGE